MDYEEAGVDREATERTVNKISDILEIGGGYSGKFQVGDNTFGLTTDGVGTKTLVADALQDYSTIGIDCIAMNYNDLIAAGLQPVAFVDYIVVEKPDKDIAEQIARGLSKGAEISKIKIVGGEVAVMPEIVNGIDLAGACFGIEENKISSQKIEHGDLIVGFPSSGIHSNGLTLARRILEGDYKKNFSEEKTIGEELLEPTRIYTDILEVLKRNEVKSMSHITGGGFKNLQRMGNFLYNIDQPLTVPDIFDVIKNRGDVKKEEMYKTFNMGMGFALIANSQSAEKIVESTDGKIVGNVESGNGVKINNLKI